jgi:hypothetical protein
MVSEKMQQKNEAKNGLETKVKIAKTYWILPNRFRNVSDADTLCLIDSGYFASKNMAV